MTTDDNDLQFVIDGAI